MFSGRPRPGQNGMGLPIKKNINKTYNAEANTSGLILKCNSGRENNKVEYTGYVYIYIHLFRVCNNYNCGKRVSRNALFGVNSPERSARIRELYDLTPDIFKIVFLHITKKHRLSRKTDVYSRHYPKFGICNKCPARDITVFAPPRPPETYLGKHTIFRR